METFEEVLAASDAGAPSGVGVAIGFGGVAMTIGDQEWRLAAACRGRDTDMWFGEPAGCGWLEAVTWCATCAVRFECLEFALEARVSDGIWGGLSASHIAKLRRQRKRAA